MTRRRTRPYRLAPGEKYVFTGPDEPVAAVFRCRACNAPQGALRYFRGNDQIAPGWRVGGQAAPVTARGVVLSHARASEDVEVARLLYFRAGEDDGAARWLFLCPKCDGIGGIHRSEVAQLLAEWRATKRKRVVRLDLHEDV